MQFKFLLALLLGALLVTAVYSCDDDGDSDSNSNDSDDDSGSGSGSNEGASFQKSSEKNEDRCHELTEGADQNDGECDLIDGLNNCTEHVSDPQQKQILIQFIAELKLTLSVKVDISVISSKFLQFQSENPAIWEQIAYQNITTTGFMLVSYTKTVTLIQSRTVEAVYTVDEDDTCSLTEGLLNCSAGIGSMESAAKAFVEDELLPLLKNSTLPKEKRVIAIAALISQFTSRSSDFEAFWNCDIQGFGSLRSFQVLAETYQQTRYVKYTLNGTVDNCILITSLEAKYQELIAEGKLTIAVQFNSLIEELKLEFSSVTSYKARLGIFVNIVRKYGRLNFSILQYLYEVYLGKIGTIFDLIWCYNWVHNPNPVTATPVMSTTCSCSCN